MCRMLLWSRLGKIATLVARYHCFFFFFGYEKKRKRNKEEIIHTHKLSY